MKLNRRGRQVRAVLLLLALLLLGKALYEIVAHLWFTGSGYCWGTAVQCMKDGL